MITFHGFQEIDMNNLQYEIRIYQTINDKATMTMSSYFDFRLITRTD